MRDVANVLLLAGVDYFFVTHPTSHIPLIDRSTTVVILAAFNAAVLTQIVLSRVFARLTARRIASTWGLAERARFFGAYRHEQASK